MAVSAANLKLYLSGGAANADPNASLGGAKSVVAISGTALNCMFDNIAGTEAASGQTEYRCLYFVNEDADATGLIDPVMWVSKQPNVSNVATGETIEIGLDLAGKNGVADTIASATTAPSPAVTFDDPATKGAGIALPSAPYTEDDYVAIWFKRITPSSQAVSVGTSFTFDIEGES
jgi:hypothetical protein